MKHILLVFVLFNSTIFGMSLPWNNIDQSQQLGQKLLKKIQTLYNKKEVSPQDLAEIKAFISQGANINSVDIEGQALLHNIADYVASNISVQIATLLINYGANIDLQSINRGDTPLMRAVIAHNVPLVKLLANGLHKVKEIEELGINDNSYFERLPADMRKMALEYLKVKANPNIKNKDGRTALDIARQNLNHMQIDPEFFRNIDLNQRISDYQEIIKILEPITFDVPINAGHHSLPVQAQKSWWQRLWRR